MAKSTSVVRKSQSKLPSEIYNHLENTYLRRLFGPRRRLFASKNLVPPESRMTSKVFLAAYKMYRPTLISDNIWVFDGGDFWINHKIFGAIGDPGIRRADLILSLRDPCYGCMLMVHEQMTPVGEEPVLWGPEQLEWDVLRVMDRYLHNCGLIQSDIMAEWKLKFDTLTMYPLDYLLLDMTEAHSLDGHYIGVSAADDSNDFPHGKPAEFVIKAPSLELEAKIKEVILKPNSEKVDRTALGRSAGW